MRRPAASGTGKAACAAFIFAKRLVMLSGNGTVLRAAMSTCSAMFSDVADSPAFLGVAQLFEIVQALKSNPGAGR